MLKYVLLTAVLVLGPSTAAQAHQPMQPPVPVPATPDTPPQGQPEPRVKLYYRECVHLPWKFVGCFECIHDAQDAAKPLQSVGYQVYFRNCR